MADTDNNKAPATFEEKVLDIVSKAEKNESGALILTDEILAEVPEELVFAAKAELRYRNTQAGFTKAQQEVKKLSKVKDELTKKLEKSVSLKLTKAQKDELDDLKLNDPDAWREKLQEYETEAKKTFKETLKEIEKEGENYSELELRQAKLEAFSEETGLKLNDEIIDEQLPAGYKKKLESGAWSFDKFLEQAHKYLTSGKVVKGAGEPGAPGEHNLNQLPGGKKPSKAAVEGDIVDNYSKAIF